jgi:hypothetical protein
VYHQTKSARWAKLDGQARDLMLPLADLRKYAYWRETVLTERESQGLDAGSELKNQLIDIEYKWLKPVEQYQFPVVTLPSATSVEAVCTIFETLNRTGVKLSVFDLLAARGFADNVRLRDLWQQALNEYPILADFRVDPYYVLQVIATWVKGDPRRGQVLALAPAAEIQPHWAGATRSIAETLLMLRDECGVLRDKWLPYGTMLITLAAVWPAIHEAKGPTIGARRGRLKRWFWCATFNQRYENQTNSRTEADVPVLLAWLKEVGRAPEALERTFDPATWRGTTYRQTALYKASMALLMSAGATDFHKGQKLTGAYVSSNEVDDHHIFPAGYLVDLGASDEQKAAADTILNRTLIDKLTNIRIGKKAPHEYLSEMRDQLGEGLLATILESHSLPIASDGPLWSDRYDDFLTARLEALTARLEQVTGWETTK